MILIEYWSLKRRNEEQLQIFERRILRKIFVIMENGVFVIIVNYTLYIQTQI